MKEKDRGITLIALVITVIILLILAGTAISISINNSGLFEKTQTAVQENNNKVDEEDLQLKYLMAEMEPEWDGSIASSFSQGTGTENDPYIVTSEELKNIDTLLDKAFAINEENDSITISEQEKQNIWTKDNENKNNGYPIFNWQ